MKKDKISDVQERFLQQYALGFDAIAAYREVTGNKKVSASSIRSTIGKWMKKEAIRTRLDALRKTSETDRTLQRQMKREILSGMVWKLLKKFDESIERADTTIVKDADDASIKSIALSSAEKLAGRIAKLIQTDNQMSGDNAPKELDVTSAGQEISTLKVCLSERINQLKAETPELYS